MIVIAIIGIIMGIGMFPYSEYIRQARLSSTLDMVAQEWILAHKEVRNGKEFPLPAEDGTQRHASILLHFQKESSEIKKYLIAGTGANFPTESSLSDREKSYLAKTLVLEGDIQVKSFSGITDAKHLYYFIEAPFGEGKFYTDLGDVEAFLVEWNAAKKQQDIDINYEAASNARGHFLLRGYLQ